MDRELHVEIGCNAGHVIVEWAAAQPQTAYIGIDWKLKSIFRAAEKAEKRKLSNVIFFRAHAARIKSMFGPAEVDRLSLFFPDPWPKKSQWKNRFVTPERYREIREIMKPGGILHIKTDHPDYFKWMEKALDESHARWKTLEKTSDLHQGHPNPASLTIPEVTLFERLFIKEGIPIHSLKLSAL